MLKGNALCQTCTLRTKWNSTGFAPSDGKGKLKIAIIAEALGEDEAKQGLPLVGRSGKLFNRMLSRTEDPLTGKPLGRDDFLISNIIWCRPPNNILSGAPYEEEAIAHCSPNLAQLLDDFQPKVILALGNQPMRWLTGHSGILKLRGYMLDSKWGPVIPTYHPSYIQRGKFQLARVWRMDLLKALYIARNGPIKREANLILRPSPMEWEAWVDNYLKDPTLS